MGKCTKEESYYVEVITKARVRAIDSEDEDTSVWEYRVKWSGYDSDSNTWEPVEHLRNCPRLLDSFWSHIDLDDGQYNAGFEVAASRKWIQKEKDFFAKNYKEVREEKHVSATAKKRKAPTFKEAPILKKQRIPERINTVEPGSSSEDESQLDDIHDKQLLSPIGLPSIAKSVAIPYASRDDSDQDPFPYEHNIIPDVTTLHYPEVPLNRAISVKQRLSRGALAPMLPKEIAQRPKTHTKPPPSGLNFLKQLPIPVTISQQHITEAERFLQNMIELQSVAPIESEVEANRQSGPLPLRPIRVPLPTRKLDRAVQQSYKVFIGTSEMPLCRISIQSTAHQQGSPIFQTMKQIRIDCMYDVMDMRNMLPLFRQPTQLGLLGPAGDADEVSFDVLVQYMERSQKVNNVIAPIFRGNIIIGQSLFCPHAFCSSLGIDVPPELSTRSKFFTALLPYASSPTLLDLRLFQVSMRSSSTFVQPIADGHIALKALGFPQALRDAISESALENTYHIWPGRDNKNQTRNPETYLLQNILKQAQGRNTDILWEARVVFIHVGALRIVHRRPGFVEGRKKSPYTQFYAYGSGSAIPLSCTVSFVREIWPCGGIVVFSPSAVHEDPIGCRTLISQICQDGLKLWASYILPSSLGYLAELEFGNEEPAAIIEKLGENHSTQIILKAIEEGDAALLRAPPAPSHNDKGELEAWFSDYASLAPPTKLEALEKGRKAFLLATRSGQTIEDEIVKDLSVMECHPAFIEQYRRYVIIQSKVEANRGSYPNVFERATIQEFDFGYQIHPKQALHSIN